MILHHVLHRLPSLSPLGCCYGYTRIMTLSYAPSLMVIHCSMPQSCFGFHLHTMSRSYNHDSIAPVAIVDSLKALHTIDTVAWLSPLSRLLDIVACAIITSLLSSDGMARRHRTLIARCNGVQSVARILIAVDRILMHTWLLVSTQLLLLLNTPALYRSTRDHGSVATLMLDHIGTRSITSTPPGRYISSYTCVP
jgi:hypothetical protein